MESAFDLTGGRSGEHLPDELPADPMPLCKKWFDEAREKKVQPNPNVMTLATLDPPPHGRVSARMVLCKEIDVSRGSLVFYTNYTGRKGVALETHPYAAAVFHWDVMDRQIRIEGHVTRTTAAESDAYFATRPWESQIGAWASEQSRPIGSRQALRDRVAEVIMRFGIPMEGAKSMVPRPPHWGGYRLWAERVELWCAGEGRIHDRAAWMRTLKEAGQGFECGPWSATRLQP
jgi:pyridoxamine 5'-phosphate oxidase